MSEPSSLATLCTLLRSRLWRGAAAAHLALALAAGSLPLLAVPGFELGEAAALASALALGPCLGIAAARLELARAGTAGGELSAQAGSRCAASALRPFLAAAAATSALPALLFAASAARAALATPCRALAGFALFTLAAAPSALLSAALGVAATLLARGRRGRAALLYFAVALASFAATLLSAYFGPAASAHDHLLGFWPGPLYDEAIPVDARLLLFRAGTLAWTAAALAAAALVLRRRSGAPWRAPAAWFAAAFGAAILARAAGGATATRAEIARALGGVREGPRCVVHLARERSPSDSERVLRDCEYDAHAVAGALGLSRPPRATVWLYRSPEEKRRLVGAGRTSFTKPWLAEIHVHEEGVPHPILRHELVHALASATAAGPLRVPARAGLVVNAGLVEGLAVALEVPAGGFDVHGLARAMRDEGRLPPLTALLGAGGFLGAAPARAYTASGSFLRFLLDRYGPGPVRAAYRGGDVATALGRPLADLDAEWQRFLDGVTVPPALAAAAEARFERASLFDRACAREVASLERAASREAAPAGAAAAEGLLRRASALSGGDPSWLRPAADAWRAAGDLSRAEALLREALERAEATGGRAELRSALLGSLGDLALRRGDGPGAEARYRAALALAIQPDGAEARALRAKLVAAGDPAVRGEVGPWLLGLGDPGLALARLAQGEAPLARYLLARARLARGAPARALADLGALEGARLPSPAFEREARRMAAEALCLTGRWEAGVSAWNAIATSADGVAPRVRAEDAARRCAFERDEYGAPIAWEGDDVAE